MKKHFFEHDYSARNDQKILQLRYKCGAEGYGVYWMLLEVMAEDSTGYIQSEDIGGLSLGFGVAIDRLIACISECVKIGLFKQCEHGNYYAERMLKHKSLLSDYSKFGVKGAEIRWKNSQTIAPLLKIDSPCNAITLQNSTLQNKKKNTFVAPSFQEFLEYCKENGFSQIAEKAFKYYSTANWKDGKGNQVKNWKQKLISVWFKDENKDRPAYVYPTYQGGA